MITDNAPCHSSIEEIFENEFDIHRLLRLGQFSSMLNAIEYTWSKLKAGVKKDVNNEISKILNCEGRLDITQTELRLQQLENIIQKNINEITVSNCTRNITYVQRFIPGVLNMEDVIF